MKKTILSLVAILAIGSTSGFADINNTNNTIEFKTMELGEFTASCLAQNGSVRIFMPDVVNAYACDVNGKLVALQKTMADGTKKLITDKKKLEDFQRMDPTVNAISIKEK